ncbi:MAG: WXG100 family type VII secretion target [Brachybacterium sp.]|uniref:WXG100 family type VII secretion target n=1 Tax=Brachybacterium sp. TaxID=1891286 RepID=UPI0026503355|nr:WXG100 family type VII secretion target [Brachybacterium sp.]MDN6301788.1 WXG100 family type VII secretion target [Brachybacterium sp.]MDN6328916.1 WXG100 family type VII secretion target [Brachybacterium sp.]MDN6399090.1 WXG100 family type VII secretion target [Brachybacterium sp.]
MTGFQGADTEQLREHAELMRDRAKTLDGLRTRISMLVAYGAEWEGGDAEAFRDRWRSEVAPTLDEQIATIEARGTTLDEQAEQQDAVSEAEQAPGFLENALGLAKEGQGIFTSYKKLRDLAEDFPTHMGRWKEALAQGPNKLWDFYKSELKQGLGKALNRGEEYSSIAKKLLDKAGLPDSLGNWDPLKKLDTGKFPSWLDNAAPKLGMLGKLGGKAIPGLDIGLGVHQMMNADNTFDKVSGGLSAVSGGLVLAAPLFGPAAPIVAGVGVAAGVVSIGMDLGKMAWENREAIADFAGDVGEGISNVAGGAADAASNAAESIGNGLESAGDAVSDAAGNVGDAIGDALDFGW